MGREPTASLKLRLAAILAFRGGLQIFVSTLLFIPVVAIINRISNGSWYVNWRLILIMSTIFSGGWFLFSFITQVMDDWTEGRREQTGNVVFPGVMWVRAIYSMGIVLGIVFTVVFFRAKEPIWLVVLPLAFVALGIVPWPRAIEFRDDEIRQRGSFFVWKAIQSVAIQSASFNPTTEETMVCGSDGTTIVHTNMHASPTQFVEHLERFMGKSVVILDGKLK